MHKKVNNLIKLLTNVIKLTFDQKCATQQRLTV